MANSIFEQFEELYSRWSILDKVGKEIQLARMWQQVSTVYGYLCQLYQNRGYLTHVEANYANQICQMLIEIQKQKMKIDQDLSDQMMKHLMKMTAKQK